MSLSDSTQTGPRCMSGAAVSLPDHQPARVAVWGGQSTQRRGEAPAEDTTHLPHPWLTYSVSSIFWNQLCPPEVLLPKKAISLLDAQPCGHTPHPHARPDVDTQDTCILSHVQLFATPWTCSLPGSSVHGASPGKSTGVGCHLFLQGIIPTQGSNLCLLHWQADFLPLSHLGIPRTPGSHLKYLVTISLVGTLNTWGIALLRPHLAQTASMGQAAENSPEVPVIACHPPPFTAIPAEWIQPRS